VGEENSPLTVHYDHRDVGDEPLGWIVPNQAIRLALLEAIARCPTVEVAAPASIARSERGAHGIEAELTDGRLIKASLLAVCEGRFSKTRESLGIGAKRWAYGQTALVCTLAHELPHRGRAVERFFPDGPFAMLPLPGNRSSIVWALDDTLAESVQALDDGAFTAEVQDRFGDSLGRLSLEGHRWSYPLVLVWSDRYTAERAVLVGDTARGIHPIAGQGWNLAVRDVTAIAEIVVDRLRLGLDPGSADALERYAAWRSFDSLALVAVTNGINRLFANDVFPLKLAREGRPRAGRPHPAGQEVLHAPRHGAGRRPAAADARPAALITLLPPALGLVPAGFLVLLAAFTSALTAIAGIGGGVVMLGAMASLLPAPAIIPVHAVVQLGSNVGRAFLLRRAVGLS
jgi:2-octaprenyl-6-methoxyphenol hydroxylase